MSPFLLLATLLAAQSGAPRAPPLTTDWPPYSLFSPDDYPAVAIRGEEQGTTRFRIEIGRDGRVTRCAVTGSSGSNALDLTTCRIVRNRARFTPARDRRGRPVPDVREGEISWRMDDE